MIALLAGCSPDRPPSDDAGADAGSPDAGAPDASGGPYRPFGADLTPPLSDEPVRTFTEAPAAGTGAEPGRNYYVVIETDVGRIVVDVFEPEAPIATNSFLWLVRHHYYDGVAFHRVIDGFMAQTGDPNTLGSDRSTWGYGGPGYTFALEGDNGLTFDGAGVLGMARSADPNSNGSQFFITFAPASHLDGMYTVFGHVVEGLDVLDDIVRSPAPDFGPPATPTRILEAYAVEVLAP